MLIPFLLLILFAGIALVALAYGLFTLIMKRIGKGKYLVMLSLTKRIFGEKWGNILHYVFFTILPLLIGVWLIINIIIVVK